ncbi:hypothetical protein D3C81_2033030 [compost metagenome]
MARTYTMAVPLARLIISLNPDGKMVRSACGRIMRTVRRQAGRPSAAAASYWP